jgi:hypothetical protein
MEMAAFIVQQCVRKDFYIKTDVLIVHILSNLQHWPESSP